MKTTTLKTMVGCSALAALLLTPTAALAAEEEKPSTSVDASKGGITFKSGDNSLTFGAFAQLRALYEDKEQWDGDTDGGGDGIEDGGALSFDIPRVRLTMRGTMWKPWLKYTFSYEMSRTSGESSSKLKDAYLEFAAKPLATLRVGQFKVPFGLQELTGDQYQQFVERAITNTFDPSREMGITLQGVTGTKLFGYQVGLFNGSGESIRQEDDTQMYAARIWFDPLGEYVLREGSNENPEGNIFHVGLATRGGEIMRGNGERSGVVEDPDDQTAYGLELAWKLRRFFATAEYFLQTTEFANPTVAPDVDAEGFHVQGGFMAVPDRLELGLRYASIDPNTDLDADKITETRGLVAWFFKGHNLKIQTDFGQIEYDANAPATFNTFTARGKVAAGGDSPVAGRLPAATGQSVSDRQIRIQVQLNF